MFYICGPLVLLKDPRKQITRPSTQDLNNSPRRRAPGSGAGREPSAFVVGCPRWDWGHANPHPGPTAVSGGSPRSFQLRSGRAPEPRVLRSEGAGRSGQARARRRSPSAPCSRSEGGLRTAPLPSTTPRAPPGRRARGPPPTRTFLPQKPGEGSRGRARGVPGVRRLLRPRPHFPSLLL